VDEAELDRAFSRFGPIDGIRIISREGKRFSFVRFQMIEAAQNAINGMNGEIIGGARIRVAPSRVPRRIYQGGNRDSKSHEGALLPQHHDQNVHQFGIEGYSVASDNHKEIEKQPTRASKEEANPDDREVTSYDDL